jgi:hypothetical protein
MTLKIDFDNKTVEVDSSTGLGDIIETLKGLNLNWKEFSIKPAEETRIVVVERKTIPQYEPYFPAPAPVYPWVLPPTIIC